jgi:hypothetical protein
LRWKRNKYIIYLLILLKDVSNSIENQLQSSRNVLHIQNKSIQAFISNHQRTDDNAYQFLRRFLLHEEWNYSQLSLNFAAIASFICSIKSFRFRNHRDEYEKKFVECDQVDFFLTLIIYFVCDILIITCCENVKIHSIIKKK